MRIGDWSSDVCSSDLLGLAKLDLALMVNEAAQEIMIGCEILRLIMLDAIGTIAHHLHAGDERLQDNQCRIGRYTFGRDRRQAFRGGILGERTDGFGKFLPLRDRKSTRLNSSH